MRASIMLIALLTIATVSAAPHVTITYTVDQTGAVEVLAMQGSDRTYPGPTSGKEVIEWMVYSDGIRTARFEDRFSFTYILDTFREHHEADHEHEHHDEELHEELLREVHLPIRETTDRIVAFIEGRMVVNVDFYDAMCSDRCPTCRALFDDPCTRTTQTTDTGMLREDSSQRRDPLDPFWIIITVLGLMVLGAYTFLIMKLRRR